MDPNQNRRHQIGDALANPFWGTWIAYGIVLRAYDALVLESDEEFVHRAIACLGVKN